MIRMAVYYRAPDDPEAFEKRYLEGHLPLVQKYEKMESCTFNKTTRTLQGDQKPVDSIGCRAEDTNT